MNEPSDSINDGAEFAFFPQNVIEGAPKLFTIILCHLPLFHSVVSSSFHSVFISIRSMFANWFVRPDLFAIPFASSLLTIQFFNSSKSTGIYIFFSHFLNGCMLNWDKQFHK